MHWPCQLASIRVADQLGPEKQLFERDLISTRIGHRLVALWHQRVNGGNGAAILASHFLPFYAANSQLSRCETTSFQNDSFYSPTGPLIVALNLICWPWQFPQPVQQ